MVRCSHGPPYDHSLALRSMRVPEDQWGMIAINSSRRSIHPLHHWDQLRFKCTAYATTHNARTRSSPASPRSGPKSQRFCIILRFLGPAIADSPAHDMFRPKGEETGETTEIPSPAMDFDTPPPGMTPRRQTERPKTGSHADHGLTPQKSLESLLVRKRSPAFILLSSGLGPFANNSEDDDDEYTNGTP